MEQELLTFSDHPSSPPIFSEVHVARSLVLCVCLFVPLYFFFRPLCCLSFDFDYLFGILKLFFVLNVKSEYGDTVLIVFLLKNTGLIFPLSILVTLMITTYKTALRRCDNKR